MKRTNWSIPRFTRFLYVKVRRVLLLFFVRSFYQLKKDTCLIVKNFQIIPERKEGEGREKSGPGEREQGEKRRGI